MHSEMATRVDAWRDIDYLQGTDYHIADGEPDIRGWTVRSREGRKLGTVSDLLINTRHRMAEFIEVVVEGGEGRHVILPIHTALLDEASDEVLFLGTAADVSPRPARPLESDKDLQRELSRFFGNRRDGRDPSMYLSGPPPVS